ncbi:RNA polymerase sigma factor [Paenibacillus monticola]|uniref:Sigma-70 family RNA polymerase sigma factor n=1 Tax=Paenibacillus monticola TaxID=2666075 RepID=A0A7X2H7V7_9BACL|nr:sigma-70 family RNA polymerase sigma factor [Paenibacillus monticola]MRN55040.1 sigma-70 family RNA polymerase sigma factor [Paenibacillus monticola]
MHNLSDYELMLLVKQKRQEALSVLYDRYVSLVYSFAWKALRDEQAARDIVQSVFVRLWTTESEYNPDKGRFTSWLITITRNLSMDLLRKQRRDTDGQVPYLPEELESIPDNGASPEARAERESLKEQIRSAYHFLSKQQIELLEHFYWQGYSLKELAAHYKEPLGTVKNRLHQALKILRRHLQLEGEG